MRGKKKTSSRPQERRSSIRISCQKPLAYKICKDETISKIMHGYTYDVSRDGLRCTINKHVPIDATLWLQLDRDALTLCEEIEKRAVIIQHGILGKVVWVNRLGQNNYDVGLQFLTREEKY